MIARNAYIAIVAMAIAASGVASASTPSDEPPTPPAPEPTPAAEVSPDLGDVIQAVNRVPDNPAIDLLGAEDLKVVKPGSVKDLDAELRSLYKDGKLRPQIAIELSPWGLTGGRSSSYEDYLAHWATRLLRRFTVSIATTSIDSSESQTTLGALGLRLRLIDDADWRLNREFVQCALDKWQLTLPPTLHAGGSELVSVETAPNIKAAVNKCLTDHAKPWNAKQLAIGAALSSAFPEGKLRWNLSDAVVWASYVHAVSKTTGMTLGAKYLYNDAGTLDAKLRPSRRTLAVAGNFEIRDSKLGLLANLGAGRRWSHTDMATRTPQTVGLVGTEVQFQISRDSWLSLRFSAQITSTDSELISLVNLKWDYDIITNRK
jgi:hypothetical protein